MQFYQESWFLLIYTIDIRKFEIVVETFELLHGIQFLFLFFDITTVGFAQMAFFSFKLVWLFCCCFVILFFIRKSILTWTNFGWDKYYMNMSSHLPRDSSTTELSPSKGEIWWTKTPLNSQLLKWFSRPKLFACQKIYYSQNKLCTLVSNHNSVLFTEWCNSK